MSADCHPPKKEESHCCPSSNGNKPWWKFDYLLWPSLFVISISFLLHFGFNEISLPTSIETFSASAVDLMLKMWWGLALSIVFVGWLGRIPREIVMGVLGTKSGLNGLLRATLAGLLLDLCNHGILVVAMRLYERGASLGQMAAFLIASPWNSFSMTVILVALIGLQYTLLFILLSCIIAIISGLVFEWLVKRKTLSANPNSVNLPENIHLWTEIKKTYADSNWSAGNISSLLLEGLKDSRMILRWIFFGVVLASVIRTVMTPDSFQTYFGPTLAGLGLTILAATIIEVCSEGSAPIAADIVNIAKAPGNGFTFLMTGVSTDYTEIMSIKETTKSWKIALFLPLVTVPQIVVLGYLINVFR